MTSQARPRRASGFVTSSVGGLRLGHRPLFGRDVTCRSPCRHQKTVIAALEMGQEPKGKFQELLDWVHSKMMHNIQDKSFGYEPYFKEAEKMREEKQKEVYEEQEKEKKVKK